MASIVLLHGFLGEPQDWFSLRRQFEEHGHAVWVPSLWKEPFAHQSGEAVVKRLAEHLASLPSPRYGIGYSLGGRLLAECQKLSGRWKFPLLDQLILVSTGLQQPAEGRSARLLADEEWAQRLLHRPWEEFLKAWNSQEVFENSTLVRRSEPSETEKSAMAFGLVQWSPALLQGEHDLHRLLQSSTVLCVGENDAKYASQAQALAEEFPGFRVAAVPHAGHRVMWDNPEAFTALMLSFLNPRTTIKE